MKGNGERGEGSSNHPHPQLGFFLTLLERARRTGAVAVDVVDSSCGGEGREGGERSNVDGRMNVSMEWRGASSLFVPVARKIKRKMGIGEDFQGSLHLRYIGMGRDGSAERGERELRYPIRIKIEI